MGRARLAVAAAVVAVAVSALGVSGGARPAQAQTAPGPTTATTVPSSGSGLGVGGGSQAGSPSCIVVSCSAVGSAAGCLVIPSLCVASTVFGGVASEVASMATAFFTDLVQEVASGVQAVFNLISQFMNGATSPDVSASDFVSGDGPYHKVAEVAAVLMVAFVLLSVVQGTVFGEPGQMVVRLMRSVPLAVLAILALPLLVALLLQMVDGICSFLLPTGATMTTLANVYAGDQVQVGLGFGLPALLFELLAFFAAILIFAELVVRNALVLITVALAPLSFAASTWTAARGAARRVAEILAAIILSKLAIWVALLVGIDLFAKQAFNPSVAAYGQMIAGSAVLAVAVFAPYVVWKLLPVAEAAVIAQGLSRMPARAAQQATYSTNSVRSMTHSMGGGGGGGSSSGSAGGSQSSPGAMQSQSLGAPGSGGSPGSNGGPGAGGSPGPAGPGGQSGATGGAAGGGAAGGGAAAAGGAAAGGGAAGGGAAAGAGAAGAAAAPVAVPLAVAKAGKDKATSAADNQTSNSGSSNGSGWGYTP